MIKILIADDHAVVRQGLKQMLVEKFDQLLIGEARNSAEVLRLVSEQDWDIVILDISMPGRSGLDVLKDLKNDHPKLPVLVLSMYPEDQLGVRVLKAGANGYMNKESAPEELIEAIKKVLKGGKYVSPTLGEKLAVYLATDSEKPLHETLSDREYQIMLLIGSGKTVSEIAEELSLSVKTVSTYRVRILEKMQMKSNAELTHYAIKNHLVE